MCGRFEIKASPEQIQKAFATIPPNLPARWDDTLAPSQMAPVVRVNPQTGSRQTDLLRWGLIPHWAKDDGMGASLFNARAEGLAEKPSFREAFQRRRCLVPATAFVEWKQDSKPKLPYIIHRPDHSLFAMAGLWENWKDPNGQWVRTFTIVTTIPNQIMAPLHHRMPVILTPEWYSVWLGEDCGPEVNLQNLLVPCPPSWLEATPIGPEPLPLLL